LRFSSNLTTFPTKTERFKTSFFPSTTLLRNSIDYVERNNLSINVFKSQYLKNFFDISSYSKYFDYSIDRYSSILHTRLRLNCCTLNYYLFKIDCIVSPVCVCGAICESVTHYLLECPRYSALRLPLLSVAQVHGRGWNRLSAFQKVQLLLFGEPNLSVDDNIEIF
jgi:hypothetical protein